MHPVLIALSMLLSGIEPRFIAHEGHAEDLPSLRQYV